MTDLTIRLLGAEVASSEPADRDRVDRLLRRLAERILDERRSGLHGLSGDWCVRRLDIDLELDAAEPDASAVERWADLIAASVQSLVPDGSDVVHYPNRSRALSELVDSLLTGTADRVWAWRQLGLLGDLDPNPQVEPIGALLAAVSREPELAASVVVQTIRRVGVARVDHLLGEAGWVELAGIVSTYLPLVAHVGQPKLMPLRYESELMQIGRRTQAAAIVADSSFAACCMASGVEPSQRVLSAWAALITVEVEPSRPQLAMSVAVELARLVRTGDSSKLADQAETSWSQTEVSSPEALRSERKPDAVQKPLPDARPAAIDNPWWEAKARSTEMQRSLIRPPLEDTRKLQDAPSPEIKRSSEAGSELEQVARAEPEIPPERPQTFPRERQPSQSQISPKPDVPVAQLPETLSDATHELDELDVLDSERLDGAATEWAGLLFLLNTAAVARIPDAIDEDVRLADRSLRWIVHQLAQRMVPIPATDAAALALAGLTPDAAAPAGSAPSDIEDIALAQHAGRWADVTRDLLRESQHSDDPTTMTIWSLARRTGRIVADPGWLEVYLDLDTVDLQVRRAGLDLDPDWVGWLGTVVRFCYV